MNSNLTIDSVTSSILQQDGTKAVILEWMIIWQNYHGHTITLRDLQICNIRLENNLVSNVRFDMKIKILFQKFLISTRDGYLQKITASIVA